MGGSRIAPGHTSLVRGASNEVGPSTPYDLDLGPERD
jgi:hypothetical protein